MDDNGINLMQQLDAASMEKNILEIAKLNLKKAEKTFGQIREKYDPDNAMPDLSII